VTQAVTLFICITKFLLVDVYTATTGELEVDAEVTVEVGDASTRFWGKVKSVSEDGGTYTIVDASGTESLHVRAVLRERRWKTIAVTGVSDDKTHDSIGAMHFVETQIVWLKEEIASLGGGRFDKLHLHSDNAAAHFKSSCTVYAVTHFLSKFPFLQRVMYTFGPPGHGKVSIFFDVALPLVTMTNCALSAYYRGHGMGGGVS